VGKNTEEKVLKEGYNYTISKNKPKAVTSEMKQRRVGGSGKPHLRINKEKRPKPLGVLGSRGERSRKFCGKQKHGVFMKEK